MSSSYNPSSADSSQSHSSSGSGHSSSSGSSSGSASSAVELSNIQPVTPTKPGVTLSAQSVQEGAGKAYQSVAQSTAIAIQDATDNLRNLNTISTTAIGVALAQYIATKDAQYQQIISTALEVTSQAAINFQNTGTSAATVLQNYGKAQSGQS